MANNEMSTKVFANWPVENLNRSKKFFEALGYKFNPMFTNENAACLVISDEIYSMLVTKNFFSKFSRRQIADTAKTMESMVTLTAKSKEDVDMMVGKALEAGAKEVMEGPGDMGEWMYSRVFTDLDGHQWSYVWMDMEAAKQQYEKSKA